MHSVEKHQFSGQFLFQKLEVTLQLEIFRRIFCTFLEVLDRMYYSVSSL